MIANLPRWVWVLAVGGLLLFPSLGTYGLWDPAEIREADVAREVAEKGSFADVTVDGRYERRPELGVWLVAAGFKVLGVNELAGRFPLALCGLLMLLLAYRVGRRLVSEQAGLICALVLATTPTLLFQSRQLIGDTPYYASLLAAVGGLLAFLWPADGKRSRFDLAIGALGLVTAFLARGALLGVALPLVALAVAVATSWRSQHSAPSAAWPAEGGDDVEGDEQLGSALRSALKPLVVGVGGALALIGVLFATLPDSQFLLLGGTLKRVAIPPYMHMPLRDIGFGMFPWFAVLPLALLTFVWRPRRMEAPEPEVAGDGPYRAADIEATDRSLPQGRDALIKATVVGLAILAYGAAVIWAGYLGKARFPAIPWLAMAVGLLLHEAWATRTRHGLWGFAAVALVLALQQDFFVEPASLAFSHLVQRAKFPVDLDIKAMVRLFGLAFAAVMFFALAGAPRPFAATRLTSRVSIDSLRSRPVLGKLVAVPVLKWLVYGAVFLVVWWIDQLSWLASAAGNLWRRLAGPLDRRIWIAGGVLALAFAGWCAHYLTPQLSKHMSNKALFGKYHQCKAAKAEAGKGERLTQYLVSGRGAAYYNDGQVDKVKTQAELFALLRKPARAFVLIPSSHLGAIDRAARQAKVPYHVLDDSNSQYLIISNKLTGVCAEDVNPLRKLVLRKRPNPKRKISVVFDNRVEVIGYDVDDAVSRGGKFRFTLYYKVLARMPANQKVFVHFDQPAHRFHGDHKPLDGKYPTQYWLPGDYIVDPKDVEIPMLTTPTGRYNIMMGFYLGSRRMKVIKGASDGSNRAKLGTMRVKAF